MVLDTPRGDIIGSWHSSGFHGHIRSRTRSDFVIPFRENAKPSPPNKFLDRAKVRSTQHLFSRHDNRNSHSVDMNDLEMHFNMGLGKRRISSSQFTKDTSTLLRWDEDHDRYVTSYRVNFKQPRPTDESTVSRGNNDFEPIHIRRKPELQRRVHRPMDVGAPLRMGMPPLLAWSAPSLDGSYIKPCVGDSLRRKLITPKPFDAFNRPLTSYPRQADSPLHQVEKYSQVPTAAES